MVKAITFENHHIEVNFLKNSLDIDCSYLPILKKPERDVFVIVGSRVSKYIWFIMKYRSKVKIFIHLSDEKLRITSILFYFLLSRRSLILRHYYEDTFDFNLVKSYLLKLLSDNRFSVWVKLLPHILMGIWKSLKFYLINISGLNVSSLPLGYTDNFISHINSQQISLPLNKFDITKWSDFYGVKGNINRSIAIESVNNNSLSIRQNLEWGGNKHYLVPNYVSSLVNGNLSFNPPGYRSIQTYRCYESLFLGSTPVYLPVSANSLGQDSGEFYIQNILSWNDLTKFYVGLSKTELMDLISFQNHIFDQKILSLKQQIVRYLG